MEIHNTKEISPIDSVADFILFYCEKDETEAIVFFKKIENEMTSISGFMYNPKDANFESIENMCNRSAQVWFFVTDNFISDPWMKFLKDELLTRSIVKNNNKIVPIWNKPKDEFKDIPFGLTAYQGITTKDLRLNYKIIKMFNHPEHIKNKERIKNNYKGGSQ